MSLLSAAIGELRVIGIASKEVIDVTVLDSHIAAVVAEGPLSTREPVVSGSWMFLRVNYTAIKDYVVGSIGQVDHAKGDVVPCVAAEVVGYFKANELVSAGAAVGKDHSRVGLGHDQLRHIDSIRRRDPCRSGRQQRQISALDRNVIRAVE